METDLISLFLSFFLSLLSTGAVSVLLRDWSLEVFLSSCGANVGE